MPDSSASFWKIAPRMAGWLVVILLWEFSTTPPVSHSNSWQGVWISIALLCLSSYRLSRSHVPTSWFFRYGCVGAFLFLPRFFGMDRFELWIEYQAPSNYILLLWWISIALSLGVMCWGSAQLHRSDRDAGNSDLSTITGQPVGASKSGPMNDRLSLNHLFLWMSCVAIYLGAFLGFSSSREFLSNPSSWPFRMMMALYSVGAGASLCGLVFFVGRNFRNIKFPRHVGEFLLLALGIHTMFRLVAQGTLVLLSTPESIIPSLDSYRTLTAAGALIAAMLLMVPLRESSLRWRVFLICFSAISLLGCFELSFINSRFEFAYFVLNLLPSLVLIGVVSLDFSKNIRLPWTHWLGIAIQLWFSLVSLIWLVWLK